jgi:hypothetical protein
MRPVQCQGCLADSRCADYGRYRHRTVMPRDAGKDSVELANLMLAPGKAPARGRQLAWQVRSRVRLPAASDPPPDEWTHHENEARNAGEARRNCKARVKPDYGTLKRTVPRLCQPSSAVRMAWDGTSA